MKKLLLSLILLLSACNLLAQNIVKGTVVDKDGNPIPGVKVEIKDGTESTITELDGTFVLQTANPAKKVTVHYAGMQSKDQKIKPDMVIKMSTSNWWNTKPDEYSWIISVQGAFPEDGVKNPSIGLMVGRVKNFGWYLKGVYSKGESTDCDYVSYPEESDLVSYWTTGKDKRSFYAVTAGILFRLGCPIHVYAGAGYANRQVAWQLADGAYAKQLDYSYDGVVADYGLMLQLGKFSINGGVLMNCTDNGCEFVGNVGIGVCF